MGIGLWLVPSSSHSRKLQRIMEFRPSESKASSPRSYPHFHPHITLASGLPASIDVPSVIACIPTDVLLHAKFKSIEVGDTYHRSVIMDVHRSPGLLAFNQQVHQELRKLQGVEPRSPRFPHMSLYYIDDSEAEERQAVVSELLNTGKAVRDSDQIILDCSSSSHALSTSKDKLSGFDVGEVWIMKLEGAVKTWEPIAKVALNV